MGTFGEVYFGNQYYLNEPRTKDLGGMATDSDFDVVVYNASGVSVSGALGLSLEDNTFSVTWPGQSALSDATQLAANPLVVQPFGSVTVNIEFLSPGRESTQSLVLTYRKLVLNATFERHLTIGS